MTEEFNEWMDTHLKKVTKSLARYNKLKTSKLLFISTVVNLMGLFLLVDYCTHSCIDSPSEVVKEGDEVEAYVTKVEFDEENETGAYILSRRQLETEKSYSYLQEKLDNNEIIEAKVTEVVKGGLVVDVVTRGFVPASLISTDFVAVCLCLMDKQFVLKLKNWILKIIESF